MLLHESTMCTDANHNGLHTGTDISEITNRYFSGFAKKLLNSIHQNIQATSLVMTRRGDINLTLWPWTMEIIHSKSSTSNNWHNKSSIFLSMHCQALCISSVVCHSHLRLTRDTVTNSGVIKRYLWLCCCFFDNFRAYRQIKCVNGGVNKVICWLSKKLRWLRPNPWLTFVISTYDS